MRDIDLTNRDLFGNVSFKIKSSSVSGIENVIQKVTTLLLSKNKTTYFNAIAGSDALSAGKFNLSNPTDFRLTIIDNLINIKKSIQSDESTNDIAFADRLKDVQIKDIIFDNKTLSVALSLTRSPVNKIRSAFSPIISFTPWCTASLSVKLPL